MARKLLHKNRRGGKRLTQLQKETIVHMYHVIGSINGTANELGVTANTVRRVLHDANHDVGLGAARANALNEVAGKINGITNQILDSITPEELQTKRHEVRDASGKLLRVISEGPSLKDKAISAAIFADKQKVLTEAINAVRNPLVGTNAGDRALLLPDSLDETRRLIIQKAKRLRLLDVEFDTGETGQAIRRGLAMNGISNQEVEEADFDDPFGDLTASGA